MSKYTIEFALAGCGNGGSKRYSADTLREARSLAYHLVKRANCGRRPVWCKANAWEDKPDAALYAIGGYASDCETGATIYAAANVAARHGNRHALCTL